MGKLKTDKVATVWLLLGTTSFSSDELIMKCEFSEEAKNSHHIPFDMRKQIKSNLILKSRQAELPF